MTATIHPIGLSRARNIFGKLRPDILARLQRVLARPTNKTWDAAFSIIVGPPGPGSIIGVTLWQAVIAADPTFPTLGPATSYPKGWPENRAKGKRERWSRVPSRELLIRAINLVTMEQSA